MNNSLKAAAVRVEVWDGAAAFYVLPFMSYVVLKRSEAFDRLCPQYEYVHRDTGERVTVEPREYADTRKLARLMTEEELEQLRPFETCPWERRKLWGDVETTFVVIEPMTVDIEFIRPDKLPPAARGLQIYWKERSGDLEKDWSLFQQTMDARMEVIGWWGHAYGVARDSSMDAPPEVQQQPEASASPEAVSDGSST